MNNLLKVSIKYTAILILGLGLLFIILNLIFGRVIGPGEYEGPILEAHYQVRSFKSLMKELKRKCGSYPPEKFGLKVLMKKPDEFKCDSYPLEGFYQSEGIFFDNDEIPLDPWDNEYIYKLIDGKPIIISTGEDGKLGTDDDITSERKKRRDL